MPFSSGPVWSKTLSSGPKSGNLDLLGGAVHGLACVTVQCMHYNTSHSLNAHTYIYFKRTHFAEGGGGCPMNPIIGYFPFLAPPGHAIKIF